MTSSGVGRATHRLALLACVLLASACSDVVETADTESVGSVRDSAGVKIVENSGDGLWSAGGGWSAEPVLTIGEPGGDPDYQFGQVAAVDALSDGRIVVLDQQAGRVQVYGPDGRYRRSLGGPGEGPGELSAQVAALFAGRGDTIVVPDPGNRRILLIPPQGEILDFPLPMEERTPIAFDLSDAGKLVSQRRDMRFANPAEGISEEDLLLEQAYDGTTVDTLLTVPRGSAFEMTTAGPRFELFAPEPHWAMLAGDRLAYASSDTYRISIYAPDGRLERIVTFPHEPRSITESEQQRILDMQRRLGKNRGMPPQAIDRMVSRISFAKFWPAFARLRSGPRGTLWVQRMRDISAMSDEELENWNPQLDSGAPEWDVFEADGRYAGVIELPPQFTPFTIDSDRIYGVFRDELDVQYVQVHRLHGTDGRP